MDEKSHQIIRKEKSENVPGNNIAITICVDNEDRKKAEEQH